MGFSSTACFRNQVGKALAKLRVEFGESVRTQSERLGFNDSYVTLVSNGKRSFSYEFYHRIFEYYGEKAEEYREILTTELIKPDVKGRFEKTFPGVTLEQMMYVIFGQVYGI